MAFSWVEYDVIENNGFGQPTAGLGDGVSIVDSSWTSVIDCVIESNHDVFRTLTGIQWSTRVAPASSWPAGTPSPRPTA